MRPVVPNADELVTPAFFTAPDYKTTIGPEVVDLGAMVGFHANPEQRLVLEPAFGFDEKGRIPFEVAVIASRQNLKTGFLILQGLGKALLLKRPLQIWTAHKDSATDDAFSNIEELIEANAEFSKRVRRITHGKGDKSITFVTGATIVFRARTGKAGQALSADDIILDELFAVEPQHIGSLMPTMSTRPAAQITMCSSAPHATSAYQRSVMNRGRAGAPRIVYAEWSVERLNGTDPDGKPVYGPPPCADPECDHRIDAEGCICDDPILIKSANPSLERSSAPAISWDYITSERRSMAEIVAMYLRERMGIGEAPASVGQAIDAELWESRATTEDRPAPAALGIALSRDRSKAYLAAAAEGYLGAVRTGRYGPWLLEDAKRIALERDIPVAVYSKGPADSLIEPLRAAGVTVVDIDGDEYIDACADTYDGLVAGDVRHGNDDALNASVTTAKWRYVGERRVFVHAGMLEAATLAHRAVSAAPELEPFAFT